MKCAPTDIRYERCATCAHLDKCSTHSNMTGKQKKEYIEFLQDHISRYPNKYKLGVVMAETKPAKNIILMDTAPDPSSMVSLEDIKGMSDEQKLALKDKTILQVSKAYEVRFKVELVSVPIPQAGVKKGKKGKPATGVNQ